MGHTIQNGMGSCQCSSVCAGMDVRDGWEEMQQVKAMAGFAPEATDKRTGTPSNHNN